MMINDVGTTQATSWSVFLLKKKRKKEEKKKEKSTAQPPLRGG
jgi:hypothetical protein